VVSECLFTSSGSSGRGTRFLNQIGKDSVQNLPVFLWHGSKSIWNIMRPILESNLKCTFSRVKFSKVDMEILAGIWCIQELQRGKDIQKQSQKLRIVYEFSKGGTEVTCIQSLKPWRDRLME